MRSGISLSCGKDEITPSAVSRMHLEVSTLSEVSQGKTNIIRWTHLQNRKTESQTQETNSGHQSRKGQRDKLGIWGQQKDNAWKINNTVLLYSTAKYTQHLGRTYNGEESEKECMCACIYRHTWIYLCETESFYCTLETGFFLTQKVFLKWSFLTFEWYFIMQVSLLLCSIINF